MERLASKDTALLIHIEHSKPIEICDFVTTLNAISGLFSDYVKKHPTTTVTEHRKVPIK